MIKLIENTGHQHIEVSDTVTMSYDERVKGRIKVTTDNGQPAGIFLERGKVLQHGDVLRSEDGVCVCPM